MTEAKNKVEALLFSVGRKMSEEELGKLTKLKPEELKAAIEELRRDYETKEGSLSLFSEGDGWKLMTKEEYLPLVQGIVSETELDKALMETLAVIAWKYPILQADVIKIRNNKAYEHLRELEEAGFIAREKKGRTRTIKLTPKFFEYFQLPPGKAKTKEAFKEMVPDEVKEKVEKAEQDIEETELKIEEMNKQKEEIEQKRKEEKAKEKEEAERKLQETENEIEALKKKEVDLVDDLGKKTELQKYDVEEEETQKSEISGSTGVEKKEEKPHVGKLETYGGEGGVPGEVRISDTAAEQRAEEVEKEEASKEVEEEMDKMLHPDQVHEEKEKTAEDELRPEVKKEEAEEETTEEPSEEEPETTEEESKKKEEE